MFEYLEMRLDQNKHPSVGSKYICCGQSIYVVVNDLFNLFVICHQCS